MGSAPIACVSWWAWSWDGTRSYSVKHFGSPLIYTFLQISPRSCEHSTKVREYTLQIHSDASKGGVAVRFALNHLSVWKGSSQELLPLDDEKIRNMQDACFLPIAIMAV